VILIVLALACALSVPLTGGRLSRLAALSLRGVWLAPLALAVQVGITTLAPGGNERVHQAAHLATYVLLALFLLANLAVPGARLIALGTLSNVAAIVSNGGIMPASATAQRLAGMMEGAGFHNSAAVAHPHLLWLGDNIPVPGPLPNVLSVGDLVIYLGTLVLLHRICGVRLIELRPLEIELRPLEIELTPPVEPVSPPRILFAT